MKNLFKQLGSTFGAAVAAACCLGIPVVLSALGALGLSFLIHDAYLFPIFVGFVGLSLWALYRSARKKRQLGPFWLGLAGALLGSAALWLMVTGVWPQPWAVYTGVSILVAGSVADWVAGRRRTAARETQECEAPKPPARHDPARRAATGAALSIAAGAAFYGMYKSVDALAPKAETGTVACWGINACKGQTACTTAFNSCTGQNECRGRGFLNVSEGECRARGGQPLAGSPADPTRAGQG